MVLDKQIQYQQYLLDFKATNIYLDIYLSKEGKNIFCQLNQSHAEYMI